MVSHFAITINYRQNQANTKNTVYTQCTFTLNNDFFRFLQLLFGKAFKNLWFFKLAALDEKCSNSCGRGNKVFTLSKIIEITAVYKFRWSVDIWICTLINVCYTDAAVNSAAENFQCNIFFWCNAYIYTLYLWQWNEIHIVLCMSICFASPCPTPLPKLVG